MNAFHPARWYMDRPNGTLVMVEAGTWQEGTYPPTEKLRYHIDVHDIPGLVELLEAEGYIKPRLDERLRQEDLKVTHRLLDILDKTVGV